MFDKPNEQSHRHALSALMDGEAEAAAAVRACDAWTRDGAARADWHVYHVIGDVLRSDDLAQPARRDAALLAAVRARLAAEPVVIAPAHQVADLQEAGIAANGAVVRARRRWMTPLAVAAGFAAVASVLVVTRVAGPGDNNPASGTLAAAPTGVGLQAVAARNAAMPGVASSAVASLPGGESSLVVDGKLLRDARLDRYLAAHKQYGNSSALAVPGVVLRSATNAAPER